MPYRLSIKPGAEEDTEIAYNWYEDQKSGLGEDFLTELDICTENSRITLVHIRK